MPQPHSASIASFSSNDASTNIAVRDVGSPRLVVVKNANTGITVASDYIASGTDNALLDVSSQDNPFRGEITVHNRNSDLGAGWTSRVFDKIFHGDSFVLIVDTHYNPPIVRGQTWGFQNRVPKLLKFSRFTTEIMQGEDNEYVTDG